MKTLLFFTLLCGGCALVTPKIITTEISKTDTGFKIVSPKDTTISYFSTPGGYTWFGYTAKASPDALKAGTEESSARQAAIAKLAEAAAALK